MNEGRPVDSIIDAHHHVWDLGVRDQAWLRGDPALAVLRRNFDLDELRADAAGTGVVGTVLVQTVAVPDETPEMLALAAAEPLVRGVVGWVDLLAGEATRDAIDRLRRLPGGDRLVGIRHLVHDQADPDWLTRPEVLDGLRGLAESGVSYDLLVRQRELPAAIRAVESVPELTYVLDHCAKPPIVSGETEPWASLVTELAGLPNVVCKLSGLVSEADPQRWTLDDLAPYVEVVRSAFGPDRLLFGSDWPVCRVAASYTRWLDTVYALLSDLSPAELEAVLSANARRVYRLAP